MQAVFSPLIAAVLLIHAVLGCCWQHAREVIDAGISSSDTGRSQQLTASDCCTHDHSSQHEHQAPGQPCDCRWECHATCVYLAEKASYDSQLLAADFLGFVLPLASFQPTDIELIGPGSSPGNWPGDSISYSQPALRLHVLNQLWLI